MSSSRLHRFLAAADGAITVLNLFAFAAVCMLCGLALDVANAYKVRTELQIAADTASHAALYNRGFMSAADAKAKAIQIAADNLGLAGSNQIVTISDITFGTWDDKERVFSADPLSRSAVRVTALRNHGRSNPVGTFLLRFVGFDAWDVGVQSVAATYRPGCLREGFVSDEVVDIQSNNGFYNGFCLHANEYISVNQNNYFEAGTVVSMPNSSDIDMPASGFVRNDGLLAALRDAFYKVRVVEHVSAIISGLRSASGDVRPDYILNATPVGVAGRNLGVADFAPNRVNILTCNQGQVTITKDSVLRNMVILASCPVSFASGVALEDVVFGNTSAAARSFDAPSGLRLGRNDNCAPGGGAQVLTMGGVHFASKMEMYGSQILAVGDVEFTAQADGIEGASIVAKGTISGTSNMSMGLCNGGMEDNFEVDYYRIVG